MLKIQIVKPLLGPEGYMELNVDLELEEGSTTAIFGASGSGKTTLLKSIAGIEKLQNSTVQFGSEVWHLGELIRKNPKERQVAFVFQDFALFPNMTVRENIAFAWSSSSPFLEEELLQKMSLTSLGDQKPGKLSSGQKQRVAIARALAQHPKVLLMDEPFSALDLSLANGVRRLLRSYTTENKVTTILVTHQLTDIAALASRVIELEKGKVVADKPAVQFMNSKAHGLKLQGEVVSFTSGNPSQLVLSSNGELLTFSIGKSDQYFETGDKVIIDFSKVDEAPIRKVNS